ADHKCPSAASKKKTTIPCDQCRRRRRRDQVSPTESDKFRNRQQEQIEHAKGSTHHEILKGMDLLPRCDFEKKECSENEHKKEHASCNGALDIPIRIQDRQELRAEKRI